MNRRILVAGGAGFVGSHLVERFLAEGDTVVVVDNLLTGSLNNLATFRDHPRLCVATIDAADVLNAPEAEGRFDAVLHFASPASPPKYFAYPIETLHAGSNATEALLRLTQRDGARFVIASTSEVYGDPAVHPQPETYWGNVNPTGPRSVYDEAKRYAEALTMAFRRSYGVDTGILRLFNTYGPRMDPGDGRAIPAFISAALANEPLPLHGDGSQTRSLCYVSDLVELIVRFTASAHPGPMNVGNPHEQTLRAIADTVAELVGCTAGVVLHPRPTDDPERRKPDITLARTELGWEPVVPARDGLAQTVAWFRDRLRSEGTPRP